VAQTLACEEDLSAQSSRGQWAIIPRELNDLDQI
jgi:hypothetical protein